MYSDSMVSADETFYRSRKIYRYKGELIGVSGNCDSIEKFLRWYRGSRAKQLELMSDDKFDAVVVNRRGIFMYPGCTLPDPVIDEYHFAGSGAPAARAAMLAGASPRQAIEIACQVMNGCGLPVQEELL